VGFLLDIEKDDPFGRKVQGTIFHEAAAMQCQICRAKKTPKTAIKELPTQPS